MEVEVIDTLKDMLKYTHDMRVDIDILKSRVAQLLDDNAKLLASVETNNNRLDELETGLDEHNDIIAQSTILENEYKQRLETNNNQILEADYSQISNTWKQKLGINAEKGESS